MAARRVVGGFDLACYPIAKLSAISILVSMHGHKISGKAILAVTRTCHKKHDGPLRLSLVVLVDDAERADDAQYLLNLPMCDYKSW